MSESKQQLQKQKVVQYLNEAHAMEHALVRVLQSQIAMTPRGYVPLRAGVPPRRDARPCRARRRRLQRARQRGEPLMAVVGVVETVVGQALALGKTPFDLLRGSGGEEKVLKNAKDACATEALEIATYTALERLASGSATTRRSGWPRRSCADEQKMLERVLREIPKLTDAVVRADVKGRAPTTSPPPAPARRSARPARRPRRRPQDDRGRQADGAPGPQGPGRRAGRRRDQGRRRLRGRPRDRALRLADGRGDHRPPRRTLADRSGQDRRLRAQEPEPHDGPGPSQLAARRRAVGRL